MNHTAYYPHSPRLVQEFRNATAAIKPNETSLMRHEGPCFKCGHLTPSSNARFRRGVERIKGITMVVNHRYCTECFAKLFPTKGKK